MFRLFSFFVLFASCLCPLWAAEKGAATQTENVAIDTDKISIAIGHVIARQFDQPGFAFNFEKVIQGMHEAREGKPSPMNDAEIEKALAAIQEKIFLKTSADNLAKAGEFLLKNKSKAGIVSVDDKLQYEVMVAGNGETVSDEATPLVHYIGKLSDGTVFGNSYDLGQPVPLPLKQTIQGFSKGIAGMREGEKRTLYIHPDLGYGEHGHLPPNSLLIFEVEVVKADSSVETIASQEG